MQHSREVEKAATLAAAAPCECPVSLQVSSHHDSMKAISLAGFSECIPASEKPRSYLEVRHSLQIGSRDVLDRQECGVRACWERNCGCRNLQYMPSLNEQRHCRKWAIEIQWTPRKHTATNDGRSVAR